MTSEARLLAVTVVALVSFILAVIWSWLWFLLLPLGIIVILLLP